MTDPFSGRSILITGGAGFLGRGIIRHIIRSRSSARITVYSRDEHKHHALRARFPDVRTILGDVRDVERLRATAVGHDTIIHAAAMKHIPESERDVSEAVKSNILGSMAVIEAAQQSGSVRQVLAISTDKAASPRNLYGLTKATMERLMQEAQRTSPNIRFNAVRYGNVVSSTGSVVPLFREQLMRDGRVTITSAEMTRFWISIDDAVQLIGKALGDDGRRGYTYVARCAAMSILDVARAVGGPDVPYRLVGVRPGEKIHETLVDDYEASYSMTDGEYILIPPAASMSGEASNAISYRSDRPARWMSSDEFWKLVNDAEAV